MKALGRRLGAAWHVLRGKPLMYRVRLLGGVTFAPDTKDLRVVENVVYGDGTGAAYTWEDKEQPCTSA